MGVLVHKDTLERATVARKISKAADTIVEAIEDHASDAAKASSAAVKLKGFKKMSTGAASEVTEVIPSSMEVLNRWVLGCGGWPVKRVSEIFSDPSAGKTSLAADALGQCARLGGIPILVETEGSINEARFRLLGCDPDDVYLSEPASIEEALEAMRVGLASIPKGAGPNMLVLDSIGAGSLEDVIERGQKANTLGRKAALMSDQLPALVRTCVNTRTHMMLINHMSTRIGVKFGDPTTTPGGNKAKYAASIRLRLSSGSKIEVKGVKVGTMPTITCVKNKLAIPHHKAQVRLMFETGWDNTWSVFALAKDQKVLPDDLDATEANLPRARVALGWETATEEQRAAWAAEDAALATEKKAKRGTKKAATAADPDAESDDLFSDWESEGED